ncbi:hypothetical protein SS1G_00179 [Sclerotinia sclerotiorum 1980 UF-70]|uniref:Uncharacterized protein n=1 Tax=Sclerotinia sclerotiorum (strain ATCC 18683 / 1980 / Ss-1) TaxID=665079 RepID=A7E4F7_SCLS1|nr:hypothetical protein SS1G_00179 [Sclerotinia sclerotiorum 1980 UF-70]EDN90779.1 hypothetical protein SS1G_00179 [Sclerotinia sclerotiorum 1980 UF-70]
MATTIVETGTSKQELYLFSRRDEEEKDRLDLESNSIKVIREGHTLDPRIPKQNISRIADIATGTGTEPGGYLQWTDNSYRNGRKIIYPDDDDDPSWRSQVDMMFKYWGDEGFSLDTTGDVEKALQGLPVEDVHVTDHTDACFRRPEINDVVVEWQSRAKPLIIEMLSSRNGFNEGEAKMAAYELRKKILEKGKRAAIREEVFLS